MPVRYIIDKVRRLVITTGWGRVTFSDINTHEDHLRNDPDFSPEFNQFVDGSPATVLDISADEARTIARRTFFSPVSRRAFFMPDPAIYGMFRLMVVYHEIAKAQEQIAVFYDRDEALKWLGLKSLHHPENIESHDRRHPRSHDD